MAVWVLRSDFDPCGSSARIEAGHAPAEYVCNGEHSVAHELCFIPRVCLAVTNTQGQPRNHRLSILPSLGLAAHVPNPILPEVNHAKPTIRLRRRHRPRLGRPKTRHLPPRNRTAVTRVSVLEHDPVAIDAWAARLRKRFAGRPIAVCVLQLARGPIVSALLEYDFFVIFPINPAMLAKYRRAFSLAARADDRQGCFPRPRFLPPPLRPPVAFAP